MVLKDLYTPTYLVCLLVKKNAMILKYVHT